ncbi:hypothetical protein [Devosia sp.]|uniref:hypothetical protein n=1 Tax=Devosia sp. TaxID=1871048 RepID=UPI001ACEAA72|nr:hypothetical protein [Devosia sp.]MBN9335275.1 hypothetical protein [Devosia sp.]
MKLKMLTSYAGIDFALSPGDETDRFSDKEAKRLIEFGHAEKAPPPKKPETRQEWDDERAKLIEENERLLAEVEAGTQRVAVLDAELVHLRKLRDAIVPFAAEPSLETTAVLKAPEKRG